MTRSIPLSLFLGLLFGGLSFGGLVVGGLAACSSEPARPTAPTPEPTPEAPEPTPETPEEPVEPTLPEARTIRIQTSDGVELVGDLRAGASPEAPLVVLVHQLSSTRAEWEPLLRRLGEEPAFTTFAFDMRGHGESNRRGEAEISWNEFDTSDWERVADDIRRVIAFLREAESLQPRRTVLVGSSIGSSAVILAAAADEVVDAVVALSPGRAYRGVDAVTPLATFGERPLLVVASRGEPESAETAGDMARIAQGPQAMLVDGERHGVGIFETEPSTLGAVTDFIREQGGVAEP